jgi:hypothetical protein
MITSIGRLEIQGETKGEKIIGIDGFREEVKRNCNHCGQGHEVRVTAGARNGKDGATREPKPRRRTGREDRIREFAKQLLVSKGHISRACRKEKKAECAS